MPLWTVRIEEKIEAETASQAFLILLERIRAAEMVAGYAKPDRPEPVGPTERT